MVVEHPSLMAVSPLNPDEFAGTGELFAAAARVYGDRIAYVDRGERIGFAEWYRRSQTVAAQMRSRGVGVGEVVALLLPSGIDYAVCYGAAALLGAITAGINPRLGPYEVIGILARADPALVVVDEVTVKAELAGCPTLRRAELASAVGAVVTPAVTTRSDPVALIFSSGTTGQPKGAIFDGDNLAAGALASGVMSEPFDRRLTSTPFSHAGYMFKLWDQLVWGSTLVIPDTPWSVQSMVARLTDERITVAGAVPTQWEKLLDSDVSRESLGHLRIGVVASAPASPELVRRVGERIGVPLVVRYAMTECPTISGTDPDDPPDLLCTTVGRPAPGMAVRINDGLVEVSGPCVMREYWRQPDLTAETVRDGWLRTGDVGEIGEDGCLRLLGRSGDMYIRGGFNVHPLEVERVLARHPGVARVAVVSRPAPVIGEIGVAFVVPAGEPPSLLDVRRWVSDRLADYKAPDELVIVDELPLTAMLKPDRAALRRRLEAESG
ncbi:AMP-binding protein [Mycobacterium paraseoulense]|nr:AMP-binding protein [Mycobacterium paraseoulense]